MRLVLALGVLLALACAPAGRPRGVILISIDTLRADHLGCYGYERPTTPALDRLAAEGVRFARATAPSPWTIPSHASMLTGLLPPGHGMLDFDRQLPPEVRNLGEILKGHGFESAAFININYLLPASGLTRGFDRVVYHPTRGEGGVQTRSAPRAVATVEEALARSDERPFFWFVHTFDVHTDYRPDAAHREAFVRPYDGGLDGSTKTLNRVRQGELAASAEDIAHARDLYDAGIRQLDDVLGGLFAFLEETGLADETLVVVTSDHGEEFLEHGSVLHGRTLYDEVIRVPLLIRGPGVPRGRVVEQPVQLVDVVPTLLALLGLPPAPDLDGRDLSRLWSAGGGPAPEAVVAEAAPWKLWTGSRAHFVSVTLGDHKLIHELESGESRLFDLARDPGERHDLAAEQPERVAELLAEVEAYRARERAAAGERPLSEEQIEQLRALGYAQ